MLSRSIASLLAALCCTSPLAAQVLFWSDQFNGGVVTGGVSLGSMSFGSGSFNTPIPAGSTIHWAYLFGTQVGADAPPVDLTLNGTPYQFNSTNAVGPVFQSPNYGGNSLVHGIDVTSALDPAVTTYTINVPSQQGAVSNVYTDFYLYIAYANPLLPGVSALVYLSDEDCQESIPYTLNSPYPILNSSAVAMATVGGYACSPDFGDCENITVNGNLLGAFGGSDYNAAGPCGTSGTFSYEAGVLTGIGDDNADQAISGGDVTSDISGLVSNGATSVDVIYQHCAGGTPTDNHIWIIMLAFTSDPCSGTLDLGEDQQRCTGDTLVLNATIPSAAYTWQDGSTDPTFAVTVSGTYFVHVEGDGCTFDDTIHVHFDPLPVFDLGNDTVLCEGSSLLLDATSVPPAETYVWSNDPTDAPTLLVNGGGMYWVNASIGGCTASDTVQITYQLAPEVDLGPDRSFCEGGSATLTAGPGNGTVLWSTNATAQSITVSTSGAVWVTITQNGCSGSDTVLITVNELPTVELGPDVVICAGSSFTMHAGTPGGTYLWSDGSAGPSLTINEAGIYWVTVTANDCSASDSLQAMVEECELEIVMPNVFTPEGDPYNGTFMPITLKGVESLNLSIYNRWGQEIYTTSLIDFAWNGRVSGGGLVPEGTYFWILHYTALKSHAQGEMHGSVTVLR